MPNRIVSDVTWKSKKVRAIQPPELRPEYAWLMPLFEDNGVVEFDIERIWSEAYATARPGVGLDKVGVIIEEFIRVGLYYRWRDEKTKKVYLWAVGSEKRGFLPPPSQRHSQLPTPDLTAAYEALSLAIPEPCTGFGFGLGVGGGENPPNPVKVEKKGEEEKEKDYPDLSDLVSKIGHLYPRNKHLPKDRALSQVDEYAISHAVARDGGDKVLKGTQAFVDAVARGYTFIPATDKFYKNSDYLKDPSEWEPKTSEASGPVFKGRGISLEERMRRQLEENRFD